MNKDDYGYSYEEWVVAIVGGVVMMSLEIAGWSMFYISYKDSLKYGKYLVQAGIEAAKAKASDSDFWYDS